MCIVCVCVPAQIPRIPSVCSAFESIHSFLALFYASNVFNGFVCQQFGFDRLDSLAWETDMSI